MPVWKRDELAVSEGGPRVRTTYRLRDIHDLKVRLVPKVIDLGPEQGHTPSDLNIAEPFSPFNPSSSHTRSIGWIDKQDLLSLVEVGHMASRIDSSRKVASACSITRSAGDETKQEVAMIDGCGSELDSYDVRLNLVNEGLIHIRGGLDSQPKSTGKMKRLNCPSDMIDRIS